MSIANVPAKPRGLGFFALALGSLGLGFFCVPLVGLGFGAAGLVLGVVALLCGQRRGFAYSGTIMSALALILNLTLPVFWPEKLPSLWKGSDTEPAEQAGP